MGWRRKEIKGGGVQGIGSKDRIQGSGVEPERMRVRTVLTALVPVLATCGGRAGGSDDRTIGGVPDVPDEVRPGDAVVEAVSDASDPGGPTEAPDLSDRSGVFDASDPLDAADGPDLSDSPDRSDGSEPLDSLEANDQPDPSGPPEGFDAPDPLDGADGSDPSDGPDPADPSDSPDDSEALGPVDPPDTLADPGPPPPPSTCWSDSFEWDADPGWEATGLWHRFHAGQDLVDVWAAPPYDYVALSGPATLTKPKDGTHAFWYGRDEDGSYLGTPDDNQVAGGGTSTGPHEGALVSPWLDLTGVASATLYFWSWWEIESKHPAGYDLSTVEVTADGETWTEVARLNPPVVPPGAHPVLPYTVNGVGMPPSWHRTVVPLDAFAGGPARVRFRFRTGDVFFNAFRGWVVDEVSIECVAQIGSIPTSPKSSR